MEKQETAKLIEQLRAEIRALRSVNLELTKACNGKR